MSHPQPAQARPRRSNESGSAYIIVLLILVVLTLIGIALTFVTQTEVQLGANERTVNRTFYAAQSGISVAVADVIIKQDYHSRTFNLNTTEQDTGVATASTAAAYQDIVTIEPVVAIHDTPCNLCQINFGKNFSYVTHAVSVTSVRTGLGGSDSMAIATQRVASMVGIQPVELNLASQDVKESTLQDLAGIL